MVGLKKLESSYGQMTVISGVSLQLLWHFLHFTISIILFLSGIVYAVDSYLISSGLLKRYREINLGKVHYLAIVVDSEDALQTTKVVKLLQWLADIGAKRVCIYDAEGVVKKSKEVILKKLGYVKPFEEADENSELEQKNMIVEFASQSDGKETLARAANLLFLKYLNQGDLGAGQWGKNEIFTESRMAEALKDVGCKGLEPDLLLVYGPARCHLGFPAWRLRYTVIVHMGPLSSMRHGSLLKAIHNFTLVRQNYGK